MFANWPNKAVVSSRVNPTALATGATNFIDSVNLSRFNAVVVNEAAITSATFLVKEASKLKALSVVPATCAELDKDSPVAAAKSSVDFVVFQIQ